MRLVLDTSCVRGTPRPALAALAARGFELHVSGLAIDELAVHLTAPEESSKKKLRDRIRFMRTLIDDPDRIAPTHAALIDRLGGQVRGSDIPPLDYPTWRANMWGAWNALAADAPSSEDSEFLATVASYVEDTGKDWVDTVRKGDALTKSFGPDAAPERTMRLVADLMAETWLERLAMPGKPKITERLHAYFRSFGVQTMGIPRRAEANQAIDMNLLQHLAEGFVVVTRDYALIETVDASGTYQAPWVRTVGELISGRFPSGPPWAFSARRAHSKHKTRSHARLRELEAQAEQIARAESST